MNIVLSSITRRPRLAAGDDRQRYDNGGSSGTRTPARERTHRQCGPIRDQAAITTCFGSNTLHYGVQATSFGEHPDDHQKMENRKIGKEKKGKINDSFMHVQGLWPLKSSASANSGLTADKIVRPRLPSGYRIWSD